MSILQKQFSRVKRIDRYDDLIVDFVDDSHARIMKLFPICHEIEDNKDIDDYRRFHVRMYMPSMIYKDKNKKINKCFIILNGLDETTHFNLYDQVGKSLAEAGYGAILLPLPNHLNRNPAYRLDEGCEIEQPSLSFINESQKVYEAYTQLLGELDILIHHINQKCRYTKERECCSFYNQFFSENTRISLLGYSLGGLAAISYFLLRKNDINSCILLNSGAKLSDIDVSKFLSLEEWKEMVKTLNKNRNKFVNSIEKNIFEKVFLGLDEELLKDDLEEKSNKILFILGGADSVTRRASIKRIEPDNHGLSIMQLPGIHHFLSYDIHWDQWFPIVHQMIISFDKSASIELLSSNDILDTIISYQIKYNVLSAISIIDTRCINNPHDKQKFERTLFAAKCIYGEEKYTLIELYKLIRSAEKNRDLFPAYYRKFYLSMVDDKRDIDTIKNEIKEFFDEFKNDGRTMVFS